MSQPLFDNITLLLVTANRSLRRQTKTLLKEDIPHIWDAATIEDGRQLLKAQPPTLVMLDFALPEIESFCTTLSQRGIKTVALIAEDAAAEQALTAGAHDYISYNTNTTDFSTALRWRVRRMLQLQAVSPQPINLLDNLRCVLWKARVRQQDNDYEWQFQIINGEQAQHFLPLPREPQQAFEDAWHASKFPEDVEDGNVAARTALESAHESYHTTFRCRTRTGVRWLYEDVHLQVVGTGVWELTGICTDITEYHEDEDALYQANELLEEHVQKRTHELRNTVKHLEGEIAARTQAEVALRESESRYRLLIEQASDGITILDQRGAIMDANPRLCELLGYSHAELTQMRVKHVIQPESLAIQPLKANEILRGETVIIERPLIHKNGSIVFAEVSARMIDDGRIQCSVRDITARKLVEKDLYISQLALQTKSNSLTTINTISDMLHRSLDLQTVVDDAVLGIAAYTRVAALNLYLYEPNTNQLRLMSKHGIHDDIIQIGDTLPVEDSLTGLAVQLREEIFIEDLQHSHHLHERKRERATSEGYKSFYAIPVVYQEHVMGALALLFHKHYPLTPDELDTLSAVAKTLGVAIANAYYVSQLRAESEQRRRAEAAEREQRLVAEALRDSAAALNSVLYIQEVLDRILEDVTRVVPCDAANVGMIEGELVKVVTARGYEIWDFEKPIRDVELSVKTTPNLRQMYETKLPMYSKDIALEGQWVKATTKEWRRSYIGVPITVDGQVIGFINLDSAVPDTYNDMHLGRLQAFANQASIAIRNARYYEALQQQAAQLEKRVAERTVEVESERAQLHAILNSITEGVIFIDQAAHARYLNTALCELTGYSMEEWQGDVINIGAAVCAMDIASFLTFRKRVNAALQQNRIWQGSLRLRRRDGSMFEAAITCSRVLEPTGREVGTVMMIRDISQEKALEEQKSRFVARASHELRTPLTNLKTRLYLIPKQPQRLDEHLNVIRHVTQRMERLVDDLLDMSRLERGVIALQRRDTVLQTLIQDVANVQLPEADLKRVDLHVEVPDAPLHISVDPERLMQVVTNLVSNALKYTHDGGQITLSLSVTHAAHKYPFCAVIAVSDTGIGIANEHLPYLFQPFFRVDENTKGAGLGLSIAREIIEMHHGHIEVDSKLGSGTCFRVYLALTNATSGV